MKIKIADNVKGNLVVPAMNNSYKGGTVVQMTDAQFWAESTQWALERGYIIALDKFEPKNKEENGITLRNTHKYPIIINILNRYIGPNEVFFVSNEQLNDSQIRSAIVSGIFKKEGIKSIIKTPGGTVVEDQKQKKSSTNVKKITRKDTVPKSSSSKVSTNKNIKRVISVVDGNIPDSNDSESTPKKSAEDDKMNAYVHRPSGARVTEPPKTVKSKDVSQSVKSKDNPLILDLDNNNDVEI